MKNAPQDALGLAQVTKTAAWVKNQSASDMVNGPSKPLFSMQFISPPNPAVTCYTPQLGKSQTGPFQFKSPSGSISFCRESFHCLVRPCSSPLPVQVVPWGHKMIVLAAHLAQRPFVYSKGYRVRQKPNMVYPHQMLLPLP